jgi:hypothetical protein
MERQRLLFPAPSLLLVAVANNDYQINMMTEVHRATTAGTTTATNETKR